MRKLITLFILSIVYATGAQQLKSIEKIADFSDGLMAINVNDSWGFIDMDGTLVIDYRKDIVALPGESPIFSDGLCLIKENREEIIYYGYMNTKGETIIPTEYIVATPFENGFARVIQCYKTDTGGNNILGQDIVNYSYNELIIDTKNKLVLHISGPEHLLLSKLKLQEDIPVIHTKFIGDHLIAVKEDDNTYSIYSLNK